MKKHTHTQSLYGDESKMEKKQFLADRTHTTDRMYGWTFCLIIFDFVACGYEVYAYTSVFVSNG